MNWNSINFTKWKWNAEAVGFAVFVAFIAAVFGVLIYAIVYTDQVNSEFQKRCEKVPHSYTVISDKNKCLVPVNGKIVVKFKES